MKFKLSPFSAVLADLAITGIVTAAPAPVDTGPALSARIDRASAQYLDCTRCYIPGNMCMLEKCDLDYANSNKTCIQGCIDYARSQEDTWCGYCTGFVDWAEGPFPWPKWNNCVEASSMVVALPAATATGSSRLKTRDNVPEALSKLIVREEELAPADVAESCSFCRRRYDECVDYCPSRFSEQYCLEICVIDTERVWNGCRNCNLCPTCVPEASFNTTSTIGEITPRDDGPPGPQQCPTNGDTRCSDDYKQILKCTGHYWWPKKTCTGFGQELCRDDRHGPYCYRRRDVAGEEATVDIAGPDTPSAEEPVSPLGTCSHEGTKKCGSDWMSVICKNGNWVVDKRCQKNQKCTQKPGQDPYCAPRHLESRDDPPAFSHDPSVDCVRCKTHLMDCLGDCHGIVHPPRDVFATLDSCSNEGEKKCSGKWSSIVCHNGQWQQDLYCTNHRFCMQMSGKDPVCSPFWDAEETKRDGDADYCLTKCKTDMFQWNIKCKTCNFLPGHPPS